MSRIDVGPPNATHEQPAPPAPRSHGGRSNLFRWLLMLIIFLGGAGTGSAVSFYIAKQEVLSQRNPGDAGGRTMRRFRERFDLTPQQEEKIDEIVQRNFDKMRELREQTWPLFQDQMENFRDEVGAALTDDQRKEWLSEWEKAGRHRHHHRGRHHGHRDGDRDRDRDDDHEKRGRKDDDRNEAGEGRRGKSEKDGEKRQDESPTEGKAPDSAESAEN